MLSEPPRVGCDPGHTGPGPGEILDALAKIKISRQLRGSAQIQAFLEFIVSETIEGRSDGLKEYVLGCRVFGRQPEYDPRHDGIVRVQASSLRKRIEKYYADEGASDPVIIDLPRGGYVPVFHYREQIVPEVAVTDNGAAAPAEGAAAPVATPARPVLKRDWVMFGSGAAAAAVLAIALWFALPRPVSASYTVPASPSDFPALWEAFFRPGTSTLVGIGVPEPSDGSSSALGEVAGTGLISSFLAKGGVPVNVVHAQPVHPAELNGKNLVIVSPLRFQTLLGEMKLPADFEFIPSVPAVIRNQKPLKGEMSEYGSQSGDEGTTSYALVSLWPGPSSGSRILFIGGLHTWATQAAAEFILTPEHLKTLDEVLKRDRQTSTHGPVTPYFQILLKVELRGGHTERVEYVTHHYVGS